MGRGQIYTWSYALTCRFCLYKLSKLTNTQGHRLVSPIRGREWESKISFRDVWQVILDSNIITSSRQRRISHAVMRSKTRTPPPPYPRPWYMCHRCNIFSLVTVLRQHLNSMIFCIFLHQWHSRIPYIIYRCPSDGFEVWLNKDREIDWPIVLMENFSNTLNKIDGAVHFTVIWKPTRRSRIW